MDVIIRSNNYPVNDMTTPVRGLINELDKVIKTTSSQSLWSVKLMIVKVDIHITNKTNKSWEFVYVIEMVR